MTTEIVGREGELASIHTFLERGEGGPAALVLEGEPGIGKSTLWLAGVEKARGGHRVLSTRPAEAERGLANAGLGDLLDSVLDDVLPTLSAPRRRALEVALLVEEASGDPVDRRALAVAVRSAFEALSDREPVVIAIDDVQWLDPSSSSALSFALRRLDAANVLLLLARRVVDDPRPSELESALDPDRVQVLRVDSLSVGALHRLLRDRLDRTFARQTLLRIHERSGGNPFFALEVARALDKDVDPLEPLPVPQTLEELVRSRIRGLPVTTREALGLAAAWGAPSEALLERAGVAAGSLQPLTWSSFRMGRSVSPTPFCPRFCMPISAKNAAASTRVSLTTSTTRSSALGTLPFRGTLPTSTSPERSTTRCASRSTAAHRRSQPS